MRFKVDGQFLVPATVEVEADDALDAERKAAEPANWLEEEEYNKPVGMVNITSAEEIES